MLSNTIKGFIIRNVVLVAAFGGVVVTRYQRNKARREVRDLRDELSTLKVECVGQQHRAVRAEELNQAFAEACTVIPPTAPVTPGLREDPEENY